MLTVVPEAIAGDWPAARVEPSFAAAMVLGKPLAITVENVAVLRELTNTIDETTLGHDVREQATAFIERMRQSIYACVHHGADALNRVTWRPSGLLALLRGDPSSSLVQWFELAVQREFQAGWSEAETDAALELLEGREPSTLLLPRASQAAAERALIAERATTSCRRAALDRLILLSQDPAADASRSVRTWGLQSCDIREPSPVRGELGVFAKRWEHGRRGPASPSISQEHGEWLRRAPLQLRGDVAVAVLSRGYGVETIASLFNGSDLLVVEAPLLAAFAKSSSVALALRLVELATRRTISGVLDGLRGEPVRAAHCEYACGTSTVVLARLLKLTEEADPMIRLRATRCLVALHSAHAHARLCDLAIDVDPPCRWVALLGLRLLEQQIADCGALRATYASRSPAEQRRILQTIATLTTSDEDRSWVRERLRELGRSEEEIRALFGHDEIVLRGRGDDTHFAGRDIGIVAMQAIGGSSRPVPEPTSQPPLPGWGDEHTGQYVVRPTPSAAAPLLTANAYFTVIAPGTVMPAEAFLVEVFLHSKGDRVQLAEWSSIAKGKRFSVGPRALELGTDIDVTVECPDIVSENATATMHWDGELGVVQFACTAPVDPTAVTLRGVVSFRVAKVVIARTHFVVALGPISQPREEVATEHHMIRSAFASYATADRERVLARIQGIQKIAPFIEVFLDVISLRSGDDWAEVIRTEIKTRDVLLLFWSRAASASKYVETEWRTALEEHGLRGIDPVPLESATDVPPPAELAALHFHDWTLAIR
jgi:hypothetical protein